jgi:kynureninase
MTPPTVAQAYEASLDFALRLDAHDPLARFRDQFHLPQTEGRPVAYLCGNSLGLQPKTARAAVLQELDDWAALGVEGHFAGRNPWLGYHKALAGPTAQLVGALPHEVVVMNNLTVNLHLLMVSFYRPTRRRFKVLMEGGAFPSDQYAVESQVRFHGFSPEEAIVEVFPRAGEHTLRTEDIERAIAQAGDSLALVLFGGVNYYTGQAFDLWAIVQAAQAVGALVGFDLAHAAGNIELHLHDWGVDFAVWCSYKYLNSGPGGASGAYIHERYAQRPDLPRFAGWWGHREDERFLMRKGFAPMYGAEGWQLSNAQVLPMAVHRASLELFAEAGLVQLRQKSRLLTGFAEFLIQQFNAGQTEFAVQVITPADPGARGCQLSLLVPGNGRALFARLAQAHVVADWREPDVIRVAPVPLYNSFADVWGMYEAMWQGQP